MKKFLFATALLLASAARAEDLVTHNSVLIQADAEKIWPLIVDPSSWKAGAQLIALDAAGMKFKAVMPDAPDTALYQVYNVEFVRGKRRTMRLASLDNALMGYATWHLETVNNATLVTYDVYSYLAIPDEMKATYHEENYKRFQAELEKLKGLIENRK